MIAIVCDTPYQLMSAIMAADSVMAEGEQLIFFINTYLYLKEQKFGYSSAHSAVYSICYYGRRHMAPGKLLSGLANPIKMLRHIQGFDPDLDISCIIASRTTYIATYLYNFFIKKNPNLKLYLVEEGIGEYSSRLIDTRFTRACALLRQKTHLNHVDQAFFSAPELYPYQTDFPVCKVPPLTERSRSIIESMFNMQEVKKSNILEPYSCIILSEPNTGDLKSREEVDEYNKIENNIMDGAAQVMGIENTIIKVHPIDPDFKNDKIKTYYTKLPMETLLFNMDAGQKIFVSPMSTAMLTPKLLFGMEPFLIFTYKMVEHLIRTYVTDEQVMRNYTNFVDGVIGAYSDPTRCAIPNSIEEMKETLASFSRRAKELQSNK